jgi:hypothetical protein
MVLAVLADTPALPLHEAGKYVAGAYVVLFALVLIYVAIMSIRLSRIDGELSRLLSAAEAGEQPPGGTPRGGTSRAGTLHGGVLHDDGDADGRAGAEDGRADATGSESRRRHTR